MFKQILFLLSIALISCQLEICQNIGNTLLEKEINVPPTGDHQDKITDGKSTLDITFVAVTHERFSKVSNLLFQRLGGDEEAQTFIDSALKVQQNSIVREPVMDSETKVVSRFFAYSYKTDDKVGVFILKYTTTPTIKKKYGTRMVKKCHVKQNGETECEEVEETYELPYEYDQAYIDATDYLSLQCMKAKIEKFASNTAGTYNILESQRCNW